jgi:hypothetical protein
MYQRVSKSTKYPTKWVILGLIEKPMGIPLQMVFAWRDRSFKQKKDGWRSTEGGCRTNLRLRLAPSLAPSDKRLQAAEQRGTLKHFASTLFIIISAVVLLYAAFNFIRSKLSFMRDHRWLQFSTLRSQCPKMCLRYAIIYVPWPNHGDINEAQYSSKL